MSRLIEPGIYCAGVDICFEEPKGKIELECLGEPFTLDFDKMVVTRCRTNESRPFVYEKSHVAFEAFKL